MTEIEYRISDLIKFSSTQKPIEFDMAFQSLLQDKLNDAINDKKIEVARGIFKSDVGTEDSEGE